MENPGCVVLEGEKEKLSLSLKVRKSIFFRGAVSIHPTEESVEAHNKSRYYIARSCSYVVW